MSDLQPETTGPSIICFHLRVSAHHLLHPVPHQHQQSPGASWSGPTMRSCDYLMASSRSLHLWECSLKTMPSYPRLNVLYEPNEWLRVHWCLRPSLLIQQRFHLLWFQRVRVHKKAWPVHAWQAVSSAPSTRMYVQNNKLRDWKQYGNCFPQEP